MPAGGNRSSQSLREQNALVTFCTPLSGLIEINPSNEAKNTATEVGTKLLSERHGITSPNFCSVKLVGPEPCTTAGRPFVPITSMEQTQAMATMSSSTASWYSFGNAWGKNGTLK